MKGIIFDLDQTLIDSSLAEELRSSRKWTEVYKVIPKFKVYPGVGQLLKQLVAQNYSIAIVTTSPSVYADKVINYFKIQHHAKVCYHDVVRQKPFADQYLKAIQMLKLTPSLTYALGDRAIDIQAAHNANIISCACYWGTKEPDLLRESKSKFHFKEVQDAIMHFRV